MARHGLLFCLRDSDLLQQPLFEIVGFRALAASGCVGCPQALPDFIEQNLATVRVLLPDAMRQVLYRAFHLVIEQSGLSSAQFARFESGCQTGGCRIVRLQ